MGLVSNIQVQTTELGKLVCCKRLTTFLIFCLAASPMAADEGLVCENPLFRVEAENPDIASRVCESATEAHDSLASCGVHLSEPLKITVLDRIAAASESCLGLYHCGEGRIELLSPDAMAVRRKAGGAFAGVSDDALWDSVLVHELTHAAYEQVDCPFPSCLATSEYAAFAMQVRSLPESELEAFGKEVTVAGPPIRDAISEVMYFISPERFAKLSWQHFSARPNPCGYMELIMDGDIFFDRERP